MFRAIGPELARTACKTRIPYLGATLGYDSEAFEEAILGICERNRRVMGIRCKDGILIHPMGLREAVKVLVKKQIKKPPLGRL